ncbi:hypothetical protein AOLI_G00221360 [Acnodon oligacanthus]
MDLPAPDWTQHVEQRWTRLGSAGRRGFSLLTDPDGMFRFAQSAVRQEDLAVLSRISERYPVKKSAECATRFREQGNLSFKIKDYRSAALYYSKAACHAGKSTEQLSLCYANRSAALFHLGLYSKCLEDVQRALDEGYPSHLRHKLTDRRTQCLNRLKEQERPKAPSSKHQTPQTADKKDGNIRPPAVCFTSEKGRHLLAAEDKSAGEVAFEDEAFSFVLIPGDGRDTKTNKACVFGTEHRYCHHCLCLTFSTVPCMGCSYAQYCGQRCASEAWRQYHCLECPAGSELLALGVLAHLALRVALKAGLKEVQRARHSCSNTDDVPTSACVRSDTSKDKPGSGGETSHSLSDLKVEESSRCSDPSDCHHGRSYLGIYSLLPHVMNHPASLRFLLAFTMVALSQRLSEVGSVPEAWSCQEQEGELGDWREEQSMLGTTALRHMMQLRCNAQAVTAVRVEEDGGLAVQSSGEVRIATAVFPVLSLLNHSCCPNTSISFRLGLGSEAPVSSASGVAVTIRTCKDVAAGQELLHCYGPHCSRMDVRQRQHLLLEQYFFHCHCEVCKVELTAGTGNLATASHGLKCGRCGSSLQARAEVHVCPQSSCNYQISNTELQGRIQTLQQRLGRAAQLMENDRLDGALRVLQEAATRADSILMKTHPLQGELADATARVFAALGNWRQAASHLKRSVAAVRCQFGEDSVELGQQLFKLAQLHFNGRDRQSALSVIPSAQRLLSLHCDPHCEELQELQQMEACLHGAAQHKDVLTQS